MRIDPKGSFAGVPIVRVSTALFALQGRDWTMDDLRKLLGADEETLERVTRKLRADKLIEVAHQWPHGETVWHNTMRGGKLANASTAERVPREQAQRHVRALIERARNVNASSRFLYRIQRIRVFGSLLRPDRALVSDADVAVDLEPKERDDARHQARMEKRASEAVAEGREFSGVQDRRWWGHEEVWDYLQGDSELLHLVPPEDKVLGQTETKVVYEQQ